MALIEELRKQGNWIFRCRNPFFTVGYTPKGTSGTNTRGQIADTLNTLGMYSIVRHPLYLGNFIIWFGLSAFFHLWWFSLIVILIFWLNYERIMVAEEEFLRKKFGNKYNGQICLQEYRI